jgi:hypothetical protein
MYLALLYNSHSISLDSYPSHIEHHHVSLLHLAYYDKQVTLYVSSPHSHFHFHFMILLHLRRRQCITSELQKTYVTKLNLLLL